MMSVPCWSSFLPAATVHRPSPHQFLLHRGCYTLNHLVFTKQTPTFQYATLSTPNSPPQYPNPPPPPHPTRPNIPAQWRRCCVRPSGGLRPAPPLLLPVPTAPASTQPTHIYPPAGAQLMQECPAGPAAQYFFSNPRRGRARRTSALIRPRIQQTTPRRESTI